MSKVRANLYLSGGILKAAANYLEVNFTGGMPPEFHRAYRAAMEIHGTLKKLHPDYKHHVLGYIKTYWKCGYSESVPLPYEYDLETKTLTVLPIPKIAQKYGFYAAESIENQDIPF